MDNKMKAALIGGIVAGVLCIIPVVGNCCFLWGLGGGFLAVFMYLKGMPGPMTPGDGAKLGLRAGIIGAIIYLIIALPLMLLWGGASMTAAVQQSGGSAMGAGVLAGLGAFIVVVVAACVVGFTVLGGVIGAAVLGKGAGAPPPPPPPPGGFGGPGM